MISVIRARLLRQIIERASASLDDETALDAVELFPAWDNSSTYAVGDRVAYNGILYRCVQPHVAQDGWNPEDAASLWARVLIPSPDVIPEWILPDSTNPYMTGDKVTHNGKTWICAVDYNVWEPGVYGWDVIE